MPGLATATSVQSLAEALGTQLNNAGVRAVPYLSDTFTPPVALVGIDTIDHHAAFGFVGLYTYTVLLLLSRTADRSALDAMESYMSVTGSSSIRAALEADETLGGIAEYVLLRKAGPPAAVSINGSPYISCPFSVEIRA